MRQFRRLHLRRRAQKVVPSAFMARMIAAHAAHPWAGYSNDRLCTAVHVQSGAALVAIAARKSF